MEDRRLFSHWLHSFIDKYEENGRGGKKKADGNKEAEGAVGNNEGKKEGRRIIKENDDREE